MFDLSCSQLPGVRIYTVFIYLNDVPEGGGGGTRFTDLPSGQVTFQPQRGKAIMWPSVLADSPHEKDDRTHHEALPVTIGEKFGCAAMRLSQEACSCSRVAPMLLLTDARVCVRRANFWIHQYDFKGPHTKGCTV